MKKGFTIWLTGLSGAGKTTIAIELVKILEACHIPVEHLDGDIIRKEMTSDLGFTMEDRQKNISMATFIAKLLSRNGVITIASFISPYTRMRAESRNAIGRFVEVYVRCPLEICIQRDVKGLYKKALKGEITNFTGISDSYEEPKHPEIIVDTDKCTIDECIGIIISYLIKNGWLKDKTSDMMMFSKYIKDYFPQYLCN